MTENELDELLNEWEAPPMGSAVRARLQDRFGKRRSPVWKRRAGRIALAALAIAAVLFAVIQVRPQTVRMATAGFRIPYYVEFEFERYADDSSAPHHSRIAAFPYGGYEIAMSVTETDHSWRDPIRKLASSIRNQFVLAVPSMVLPKQALMAEPAWFAGFVASGCSEGRDVVGYEKVAGYATTVVQSESESGRILVWMAPDLRCFALKLTHEVRDPRGGYRTILRKEAVRVTMNR
jgi:hypothetical protein